MADGDDNLFSMGGNNNSKGKEEFSPKPLNIEIEGTAEYIHEQIRAEEARILDLKIASECSLFAHTGPPSVDELPDHIREQIFMDRAGQAEEKAQEETGKLNIKRLEASGKEANQKQNQASKESNQKQNKAAKSWKDMVREANQARPKLTKAHTREK